MDAPCDTIYGVAYAPQACLNTRIPPSTLSARQHMPQDGHTDKALMGCYISVNGPHTKTKPLAFNFDTLTVQAFGVPIVPFP